MVRCDRGTPERDFFERRDALRNHDVWEDGALAEVGDGDCDGDGRVLRASAGRGFALLLVEFHDLTFSARGAAYARDDVRRYAKDAAETSGYDLDVVAGEAGAARAAAKRLVMSYGDAPATLHLVLLHADGGARRLSMTGPEVRAFLA